MFLFSVLFPLVSSSTVFHDYLQRYYGNYSPVVEDSLEDAFVYCGGVGDDWAVKFRRLFAETTLRLSGLDLSSGRHEAIHDMVSAALLLTRSARIDPLSRERIALDILETNGEWGAGFEWVSFYAKDQLEYERAVTAMKLLVIAGRGDPAGEELVEAFRRFPESDYAQEEKETVLCEFDQVVEKALTPFDWDEEDDDDQVIDYTE